jgi:Methyltransferase domain
MRFLYKASWFYALDARGRYSTIPGYYLKGFATRGRLVLQELSVYKFRAAYVARYYWARLKPAFRWLVESRETSNFTYDLTARNEAYLAEMLAVVTDRPSSEIAGYVREIHEDHALGKAVIAQVIAHGRQGGYDPTARFGRRVGWYALVRALRPSVVVETGVEKGLGAMVLCAALLRNAREGHPGRYYGTDIDPGAGVLLCEPYRAMGTILYGDSLESLATLKGPFDLFINDSDHSSAYEAREYRAIGDKLSERAVIVADNAHVTDELLNFSRQQGRQFLFFREEPANHWYIGAGIGLSFKPIN